MINQLIKRRYCTFRLDKKPLYCDFEKNDYCSLRYDTLLCNENFQIVYAAALDDDDLNDVSLGSSK